MNHSFSICHSKAARVRYSLNTGSDTWGSAATEYIWVSRFCVSLQRCVWLSEWRQVCRSQSRATPAAPCRNNQDLFPRFSQLPAPILQSSAPSSLQLPAPPTPPFRLNIIFYNICECRGSTAPSHVHRNMPLFKRKYARCFMPIIIQIGQVKVFSKVCLSQWHFI